MGTGKLYIVATPIGNLEDITGRAIDVLSSIDLVLAEDTRKTAILLKHLGFHKPMETYNQHSLERKGSLILSTILEGKNIALVTDAGTPGIADPGNELIDFLLKANSDIQIIPIPGASSLTALLSVCGFNVNKFVFLGFMPKKHRNKLFEWLKLAHVPFAFCESPYRVVKTLQDIGTSFGFEKRVVVGRELTKIYETIYRGSIKDVTSQLQASKVKGEVIIVVEL